ncbi:MAG: hypothetical protein U0263_15185 [Polyangiaceae bacterium]
MPARFPENWYGIWSGPDGVSSKSGWAWKSQVTPMTDFPVQNANYHTMPIWPRRSRSRGVDATARGLRICRACPAATLHSRPDSSSCAKRGAPLRGAIALENGAPRELELVAPEGEHIVSARVNGAPVPVPGNGTRMLLTVLAGALEFEVESEKLP